MTVYVDDMKMWAQVGSIKAQWSHLFADTPEELHEFAAGIGLRRSWFQEPKGVGSIKPTPSSRAAQNWHYDVTELKRQLAIRRGAKPVSVREGLAIVDARHARLFPKAAAELKRHMDEILDKMMRG
jgi:hypothetical protein